MTKTQTSTTYSNLVIKAMRSILIQWGLYPYKPGRVKNLWRLRPSENIEKQLILIGVEPSVPNQRGTQRWPNIVGFQTTDI